MLSRLLVEHRDEIMGRCREIHATRGANALEVLQDGVRPFLESVAVAIDAASGPAAAPRSCARRQAAALLQAGLGVDELVRGYGDICRALTDVAVARGVVIGTDEFQVLNCCLDDAIAEAVDEFTRERDDVRSRERAADENRRLGFFAHELRNCVTTAILAYDVIRSGNVGVSGSTGLILGRSLTTLRALIDRALVEVRLSAGMVHPEIVRVDGFLEDVAATAGLEARARSLHLEVSAPGDPELEMRVDRHIVAGVLTNILHNAFKYTRAFSTVSLAARVNGARLVIEIADECGGLPPDTSELMFRVFEQCSHDRSGVGLGLAISRSGAEANGGTVSVRDVPGHGCVFVVDLPLHGTTPDAAS